MRTAIERTSFLAYRVITGAKSENPVLPTIRGMAASQSYSSYLDVGAANGDTLIPVSRLFRLCLAVEPSRLSFNELVENLHQSGIKNCLTIKGACGEENGETSLYEAENEANNSTVPLPGLKPSGKVRNLTLDTLVDEAKLSPPYLLKVDVEGNEVYVARGAQRTLRADCSVVSEFWPYALAVSGTNGVDYSKLMEGLGYHAFSLKGTPIAWDKLQKYASRWEKTPSVATSVVFAKQKGNWKVL